jgi:hypothetical protein
MNPQASAAVTRELDDISYSCPKCGAETKRTVNYHSSSNWETGNG